MKGKKEVHKLSSAERGGLVTLVLCMSAGGIFVPPMIIFPRKNKKNELTDRVPDDSLVECAPSGWITAELFAKWFRHFIDFTKPTSDNPVLIIFDGHYSHTRNIEIIDLAKTNHVSLVCLPPHCSHKLQPLDIAFMKPRKHYYAQTIENWLAAHPGRIVTQYQIGTLFKEAYEQAVSIPVAKHGFAASGILPYKPETFKPFDFVVTTKISETSTQSEITFNKPEPLTTSPPNSEIESESPRRRL